MALALAVHCALKIYSRLSGSLSKAEVVRPLVMTPTLFIQLSMSCLATTDCTTLVRSRQSMQLVRKTPFWTFRLMGLSVLSAMVYFSLLVSI